MQLISTDIYFQQEISQDQTPKRKGFTQEREVAG